jgi:hypothetical protein
MSGGGKGTRGTTGSTTINRVKPGYLSWLGMTTRCLDPKAANYRRYGGNGVTICERWLDFNNFLADMGPRPKGMTLDRIDGAKGYEPSNCRWATPKEQVRQNFRPLMFRGRLTHRKEIAARLGITTRGLRWRIREWGCIEKGAI